jgi:Uma2 family endonuclease
MSSLAHSPARLPERTESGKRYELHDGEVVISAPGSPTSYQAPEAVNLQFWFADVAYIPQADWNALPPDEYPVYAPPLIVEVLSPPVNRQRIVAMSAGTEEFWVVDPTDHTPPRDQPKRRRY